MRASAPVRFCGSGSRFNGDGLTTVYPFMRAGLIATCGAGRVIGQAGPLEVNPMRAVDYGAGIGQHATPAGERASVWRNYWAMPWARECVAGTRGAGLRAGALAWGRGVDVGRNPSNRRQLALCSLALT